MNDWVANVSKKTYTMVFGTGPIKTRCKNVDLGLGKVNIKQLTVTYGLPIPGLFFSYIVIFIQSEKKLLGKYISEPGHCLAWREKLGIW